MMPRFWVGCIVGASLLLAGCGPSPPKTAKVSGTITVDGQPLKDGDLALVNTAGLPPDTMPIKDGKFEGTAKQGKMKVEIRAYRTDVPLPKPTTAESKVTPPNYLPDRYNTASTLTAEVTDSGLNPSTFALESK